MKISFELRQKNSVKYSDMVVGQFFVYDRSTILCQKVDDGLYFQYSPDTVYVCHVCDRPEEWLSNLYIVDIDLLVKTQML